MRVIVKFLQKTWCDEKVMIEWINDQWRNVLLKSKISGTTEKILFGDVHTTQQIDSVGFGLQKKI